MKIRYPFFILLLFPIIIHANINTDSLLLILDKTIPERQIYSEEREKNLNNMKELVRFSDSEDQKYKLYGKLFEGYNQFNNDSSLHYANKKLETAILLDEPLYITDARMNLSEVMLTAGMYKDAEDILKEIDLSQLDTPLIHYYYHLGRRLYGWMADQAFTPDEKEKYIRLTDRYRDSILAVYPEESTTYKLAKADKYIFMGNPREALDDLLSFHQEAEPDTQLSALYNYSIAAAYQQSGNEEKALHYYTISAISNLRSGIKEYASLPRVAEFLFKQGDIDRAYNYVKCSLEDAAEANIRMRSVEVSQIFPIINEAYQHKVRKQKQQMLVFLIAVSILSIFLLLAVLFIYRQMNKVAVARKEVIEANRLLKNLNEELHHSNWQLKEINHTLQESNHIKEEYIARYIDQCSVYLEKMDAYRKSLNKLAAGGKLEELYKKLKSNQQIEDDIQDFYAGFDDAFLCLFPDFVNQFNNLLTEPVILKADERMNTEIRIFALIRLGINDSNKIAQFLRYSLRTIYNYRVRIRNRAKGERDDFENQVMKIGRIPFI